MKSRTFSHGITKKSKKDIERETEERKKKEEEECVARIHLSKVYLTGQGSRKSFGRIRGCFRRSEFRSQYGLQQEPGRRRWWICHAGRSAYGRESSLTPSDWTTSWTSGHGLRKGTSNQHRGSDGLTEQQQPPRALFKEPSPPPAMPKPKGKRAMDHFLAEIKGYVFLPVSDEEWLMKRNQAARESRLGKVAKCERKSARGNTANKQWKDPPCPRSQVC